MIEEGLRTLMVNDAGVSAKVGTRVYGVKLPQKPTLPAIVFFRVTEDPVYDTSGMTGLSSGRFQVDCWDKNLKGSRDLKEAVRKLLSGFKGTANGETIDGSFLESAGDLYDPDLDAHRASIDFLVWYKETTT